jgi:uncharacterized membrane protein YhaH (DUF805 family)
MFESINKSWSQYGNFNGRASRSEYWTFYLFYIVVIFTSSFIGALVGAEVLTNLVFLAMVVPLLSCGARRMHDVGKSGWFQIIPIYNLFLLVQPSINTQPENV